MSDQEHTASSKMWRVINSIMAVFFSLAAYVNINDDDLYIWVPMYAVPALLCISTVIKPSLNESQIWRTIISFNIAVCILYGVYQTYVLFKIMASDYKNPLVHEEGREMVGLLIILVWSGISCYMSFGRRQSDRKNQRSIAAILWIISFLGIIPLFMWSLCFISDWHEHFGHCNSMFQKSSLK